MRLFIAILLPPEVRDTLHDVQLGLGNLGHCRIARTAPDNLHLTLKFLGEVPDAQILLLCSALSAEDLGVPLTLRLSGVVGLPPRGPKRVIAVSVVCDAGDVVQLAGRVDRACHALGFPMESRPFRPHITIGRPRGGPPHLKASDLEMGNTGTAFGNSTFPVDEIALVSSDLRPSGPVHATIARFRLRSGP